MNTLTAQETIQDARNLLAMLDPWEPGADDEADARGLRALVHLRECAEQLTHEAVETLRGVPEAGDGFANVSGGIWSSITVGTRRERRASDRTDSRWTWDAIGAALGVTKQAARARFAGRP